MSDAITRSSKHRLAVLTNIIAPYRLPVYEGLAGRFQTWVITSGDEDNRRWGDELSASGFVVKRAWGVTIKRRVRGKDGSVSDLRYTHINPGFLTDLIRLRPDAVLSIEMGVRSLIAITYGALFGKPVWIWWGGTLHTERAVPFYKRIIRKLFARANCRWISYGETSTEYLESIGVERGRILQIQNCVDDRLFHQDGPVYPLDLPHPRVLVVGQLIERKGIYPLLEAVARVQREGYRFSLVVVGDGPERTRFLERARHLGVTGLHYIPWVSQSTMPSLYRSCDLMVFPTFEDVWGLVVNEALLCGLPVLSSIYAGCAQELLPPSNRFDPLQSDQFVDALRRGLEGRIAPPDVSRIRPTEAVIQMIADAVSAELVSRHAKSPTDGTSSRGWE